MNNKISIVVSAPSGAGKTTIIKRVLAENSNFDFAISTTTRAPRNGEIDGKSYYFISKEEFQQKIEGNEFLEWAVVHNNYYGTLKKEIDRIHLAEKIPVLDVDVQGGYALKEQLPDAVYIFILPPSLAELRQRLSGRGTDSAEQIEIRLNNAIGELHKNEIYDYFIINDVIEKAVAEFEAIVAAEYCKRNRILERKNTILEEI